MNFKKTYVVTTIFAFLGVTYLAFSIDKLIYFLCVYPEIGTFSNYCLFLKNLTIYFSTAIILLWFAITCIAIYKLEDEINSGFKKIYLTTVLCFLFVPLFFVVTGQTLITLFSGYEPYWIIADVNYEWEVFDETLYARIASFFIIWVTAGFCFLLSCISLYRKTYPIYFNLLVFLPSLLVNLSFLMFS